MRSPIRTRTARVLVALGLVLSAVLPAARLATASNHLILRAGTDQDLQVLNPFSSILVVDFEVFTLNYDLLLNFGPDLEPVAGFASAAAGRLVPVVDFFRKGPTREPQVFRPAHDGFFMAVVGESFCQDHLRRASAGKLNDPNKYVMARLVREPSH